MARYNIDEGWILRELAAQTGKPAVVVRPYEKMRAVLPSKQLAPWAGPVYTLRVGWGCIKEGVVEAMSDACGVGVPVIYKWCDGTKRPTTVEYVALMQLADSLQLTEHVQVFGQLAAHGMIYGVNDEVPYGVLTQVGLTRIQQLQREVVRLCKLGSVLDIPADIQQSQLVEVTKYLQGYARWVRRAIKEYYEVARGTQDTLGALTAAQALEALPKIDGPGGLFMAGLAAMAYGRAVAVVQTDEYAAERVTSDAEVKEAQRVKLRRKRQQRYEETGR